MYAKARRGFTLVELVIVIVILGVIAAIAVPRISRGAVGADESAIKQNLAVLRTAIEMFAAEHGGLYPGDDGSASTFEDQLLTFTNKAGDTSATKTGAYVYGPYLRKQMPPCPIGPNAGNNNVSMVTTGPTANEAGDFGWIYNYNTGEIIVNCDDGSDADPNDTYDTW